MKKTRKFTDITALLLAAAMLSGCLTGGKPASDGTSGSGTVSADTEAASASSEAAAPPVSAAAVASEDEHTAEKEQQPLRIAVSGVDTAYSPFDTADGYTRLMHDLTGVRLMETTRSGRHIMRGIEGETEAYRGKSYDYDGTADIFSAHDDESGITTFTVNLRSDIYFTDGEALDADDVMFTLYVLLDPAYKGKSLLNDIGVVGAANYRFDSPVADTLTDEEIEAALESEEVSAMIRERIIIPCLTEQYEAVQTYYGDAAYDAYTAEYPDARDLFVFFYSLTGDYTRDESAGAEKVISDIADMYGSDYKLLASMTSGGDDTAFDFRARSAAIEYLTVKKAEKDESGELADIHINSVSGIVKTGKYSLTISAECSETELADVLSDIVIAPLHYYGSDALYDPDAGKFGFVKGSADKVTANHAGEPLGAGAYRFVKHENGTVFLEANGNYRKGCPAVKSIEIITPADGSPALMIADGSADICFADGSAETYKSIDDANRSIEKVRAEVSENNGYGYIGFNVDTVNIGGDPLSEESCALRKALAAAVKHFAAASVESYYGDHGEITDYPVCGSVTPDSSAEDYIVPYSLNVSGEPIYKEGMTDIDRRKAVKTACLGYFAAAGYTVTDDGKISEAPEGGRLTFGAVLAGGGDGSHPAYLALKEAAVLLSEMGITLSVTDVSDAGTLWQIIKSGSHEIWAGAWNDTLRRMYISGYSGIKSEELEVLVTAAESADAQSMVPAYTAVYDKVINEWAAEIPLYKRTGCTLFSTLRVDASTLPENMTGSYGWADEIEKLSQKK